MTDCYDHKNSPVRLKLEFNTAAGTSATAWWALDADACRNLQVWQALKSDLSADNLLYWLLGNGGWLDRADGPAIISTDLDGRVYEAWYRDGRLDRENGPAIIETTPGGNRREAWYSNNQRHRVGGPAVVITRADGYRREEWHTNGLLRRADGPAIIDTYPDGTRIEEWRGNRQIEKKQTLTDLSAAIQGVTILTPEP